MVLDSDVDRQKALFHLVLETGANKCHSVRELARDVRQRNRSYTLEEICNAVKSLERQGQVILIHPPSSFVKYYFDYHIDPLPLVRLGAVIAALFAVFLVPASIPKAVVALAFLIFSPGYSLVELFFARRSLDIIERVALSVGLSVILIPVVAIMVNFALGGLDTVLVVSILGLLTIGASVISVHLMRNESASLISTYKSGFQAN